MKKYIVILLVSPLFADVSYAQVMQRKMNTSSQAANSYIKKPIVQQTAPKQPPEANKENKAISNVAVSKVNVSDIVPLNSKSPGYKKYLSQKKILIPGYNSPLFSKQYTFSDGTKMKVSIGTPTNMVILHRSNLADPKPVSTNTSDDGQMECTTTKLELTADSKTFMNNNYAGQAPFIYPGAIYTFDDLSNANFKEVKTGRNPVILTVDNHNMSGNSYEIVQNPDQVNLNNAVTQLWQRFTTNPSSTGEGDLAENIYESSTASDMAIKMGVDASGYGGSFSGYYGTKKDQKTEYLTIDCMKPMYTVSVALPDSGFFKRNANVNLSNLVVIGSVTYGSRVLANLKANFNSSSDEAGFSAGYSGWGIQAHASLDFFSNNQSVQTSINAYYVGGPGNTKPSFAKTDLENEVMNFFGNSNYQNAQPISYELYDLNGNSLGYISATDAFNVPLCIPKDMSNAVLSVVDYSNIYAPKIPSDASFAYVKTGNNSGDNKDPDTHWSFGLLDNNGNHIASFHDNSNNDPYNDGTQTGKLYLSKENQATFANFVNGNGGRIHINIAPNGHDTWNIDEFTVFLKFTNPTIPPIKLTWPSISLNEGKRDIDLTFHYDKTLQTFVADGID